MEEGTGGKEWSKGVEERNGKLEWNHSLRKEWKREWKKPVEKQNQEKLGMEDRKERTKVSLSHLAQPRGRPSYISEGPDCVHFPGPPRSSA